MFIDNLEYSWRLKDQTIFLIALFPAKTQINNILKQLPLIQDLDKLKNGLFLGGKKIQAVVSCFVGDTRESFPAKGRLQPGALNSCSICKAKLGDLNYSNPNFQHEKRDKNETKMIQKKMIESYNDKNFNLYTLRGIKEKETETGVKFQQDNIWIHELELDPTSTSHFPICWFHLLLEGLIKNIFKIMCSSMRVTFLNLANQRYKKIKLPKGFKRINNPFGTNHLTSIDVQILIQFCSLCVADLVEKKILISSI
ncbi:hypothetical protein M0813_19842 [Anaeramoeba flamelloides]|uniref:Uncharacterized protein n=1 Tax=Anaeramoeba flamelloides TaxID=1746091 RepID=A0ABQ8YN97_9EUKA|nr:hypothetical protein M0813_19842 [Anaeramoeba flamelloides]